MPAIARIGRRVAIVAVAVVAMASPAWSVRLEFPTAYVRPGDIATIDVRAAREGERLENVRFLLRIDSRISVLTCQNSGRSDVSDIFSACCRDPFLLEETVVERCWIRAPLEAGLYPAEIIDPYVTIGSPNPGEFGESVPLAPEKVTNGEIVVADQIPEPTPTATPGMGPAICGNGLLERDEQCDDRNTKGGDGCATNCTVERRRKMEFGAGTCRGGTSSGSRCVDDIGCPGGRCAGTISRATFQARNLGMSLPLAGRQTLIIGEARTTDTYGSDGQVRLRAGDIPFVISRLDVSFDPIRVPGLACVCLRAEAMGDPSGIAARGVIACGEGGLGQVSYELIADHDTNDVDPECVHGKPEGDLCAYLPGEPAFTGAGPAGSSIGTLALSTTVLPDGGTCCRAGSDASCPASPIKGEDGIPCTLDDGLYGVTESATVTTGLAAAEILDADRASARISTGSLRSCRGDGDCPGDEETCFDDRTRFSCGETSAECHCRTNCNSRPCLAAAQGSAFDCEALRRGAENVFGGGVFAAAQVAFNGPFGDAITTVAFAPIPVPTATAPSPTPTRTAQMPATWTPTRTALPTATGPTQTPSPTGTPTPPLPICIAACAPRNGPTSVQFRDMLMAARAALGTLPLEFCPSADANQDGIVTVDELVQAALMSQRGACIQLQPVPPYPTPPTLDCTYDCEHDGWVDPGDLRSLVSRVEAGGAYDVDECHVDRDGEPGIGLLEVMAAIQDHLFECRVVVDNQCTARRYYEVYEIDVESFAPACPLPGSQ